LQNPPVAPNIRVAIKKKPDALIAFFRATCVSAMTNHPPAMIIKTRLRETAHASHSEQALKRPH
jgi:hypothetical protein